MSKNLHMGLLSVFFRVDPGEHINPPSREAHDIGEVDHVLVDYPNIRKESDYAHAKDVVIKYLRDLLSVLSPFLKGYLLPAVVGVQHLREWLQARSIKGVKANSASCRIKPVHRFTCKGTHPAVGNVGPVPPYVGCDAKKHQLQLVPIFRKPVTEAKSWQSYVEPYST